MEKVVKKVPVWYWILGVVFLLWNIMGVSSFIMQATISKEALAAMPQAEQDLYTSYPSWTMALFAIAVFAGLLGAIGLLMRKKWARPAFLVSLLAIIPQMTYSIFFTNTAQVYGNQSYIMPVLVIVFGLVLVWYSTYSINKNWLN